MCSLLALFLLPTLSHCVTVTYKRMDIISKSKVELQNTIISCGLNDIAILTAPVAVTEALYYLRKPNQEVIKLNLPRPRSKNISFDNWIVKYINENVKIISVSGNTRVVNPNYIHRSDEDIVEDQESGMRENEFMIGPMLEEDHGNWVLSVYLKDMDDEWIELFQVISVEISARVPLTPEKPHLKEGDDLHLSFAYPIKNLETCELNVPNSTYDRFYDRSPIDMKRCGYVVRNVTKADEGLWEITGVGKMVFYGQAFLRVFKEAEIINNLV